MKIKNDGEYSELKTVQLEDRGEYFLKLIDQRELPFKLKIIETQSYKQAISWITDMAVRGAPAIGATGAYCVVLAVQELEDCDIETIAKEIIAARPTAKDLHTFVDKMLKYIRSGHNSLKDIAIYAITLAQESEDECRLIGEVSEHLIEDGDGILTHCNAGALATVDYGTALSPIRLAHAKGKKFKVYVDETRPRQQGRLTAWELLQEGIDHVIIADNAAGYYIQKGKIQIVITGCDRVLKDGTATNKIGTLEKALVAKYYGVPFYIAMPWTTFDPSIDTEEDIPIEFRSEDEVLFVNSAGERQRIFALGSRAENPAFDSTPAELISGYITKDGILTQSQLLDYYEKYQS
ncbi:MAG: S-methyl-5-thioribose-1-phosphate isomerase [Candidatus Heimdallarchaeota archaeon]|nr:S-methyl-5-thioribose-1-phosphate isomerase [Candidatus Heimdallarchaeota archaeon]